MTLLKTKKEAPASSDSSDGYEPEPSVSEMHEVLDTSAWALGWSPVKAVSQRDRKGHLSFCSLMNITYFPFTIAFPVTLTDRLGPGGAVSAPKGSLRAGSAFFAGLFQPFVLYQKGLGVVAANIKSLAFVRKIHHPEGSVSTFSDASVSGYFLRFMAFGKVFQFLALCLGLSTAPLVFTRVMAPVQSFSPQSWIRLRPYLHDWLIQASSRE